MKKGVGRGRREGGDWRGNGEGDEGKEEGETGRGRQGGGDDGKGRGATGREGKEGGKHIEYLGGMRFSVVFFFILFTRATPGTPASNEIK